MPNDQLSYLVCLLMSDVDAPPVESKLTSCHLCEASLWVSATMYPLIATEEVLPICHSCLAGVEEAGGKGEMQIHPRQREELRSFGALDFAEQLQKMINRNHGHG